MALKKGQIVGDLRYLGGKARNFENIHTGKIVGRRTFEEKVLGRQSFENKAASNAKANKIKQQARPARGRRSRISQYETGFSASELGLFSRRYRVTKGWDKKFYLTYNTRTHHYGTATIRPEFLMMAGQALNGNDDKAIKEKVEIIGLIKSFLVKARKWPDAMGYQIQTFTMSPGGEVEPSSNASWNHARRHIDMDFEDELFEILTQGAMNGSSNGPCVMLTFRIFFSSDTMAKFAPTAKAKRDASIKRHRDMVLKRIKKQKAKKANKTK